jgi:hypothetical protein
VDWNAIHWAEAEAKRLREIADERSDATSIGTVAAARTFLRAHAGATSAFTQAVEQLTTFNVWDLYVVADALDGWCSYVKAGLPLDQPFELRSRLEASTDLMDQVDTLLNESGVHPAAAVMLAGAALEELLRGLVLANGVPVSGKPGINSYAVGLREEDLISKQEKKLVDGWAGYRNEAAHGNFGSITRGDAEVMVQGVNLFVAKHS